MRATVPALRFKVRLVEILEACSDAGIDEVPLGALHTIAYFTDALAPIWDFPLVEAQLLKRETAPTNPELQEQVDELVGEAVLFASNLRHYEYHGRWRLDATYRLNTEFSARIIAAVEDDPEFSRELFFVREVVLALAGLGLPGISQAASADATYSDPSVDYGSVIDLSSSGGNVTKTAQVAGRFAALLAEENVSAAELTHLYVRHLYSQLGGSIG